MADRGITEGKLIGEGTRGASLGVHRFVNVRNQVFRKERLVLRVGHRIAEGLPTPQDREEQPKLAKRK